MTGFSIISDLMNKIVDTLWETKIILFHKGNRKKISVFQVLWSDKPSWDVIRTIENLTLTARDLKTFLVFSWNPARLHHVIKPVKCILLLTHVSKLFSPTFISGQVLTISLSCFHNGKFIGVVGTDITVEDLLSDITFFNQGQSTYAFMISNSGRTLIHPLLPAPTDAYGDPFFMDITTLEPDAEFKEVFESIKK